MSDPTTAEAAEYAGLIADICKLSTDHRATRELEAKVFQRLGWETTRNKRGWMIREPGESYWQSQPQILTDFGTAVHYTIGHRHGTLNHPLEENWYVSGLNETSELVTPSGGRIAAWALALSKHQRTQDHKWANHKHVATAITPAAALVAAWLRAHP